MHGLIDFHLPLYRGRSYVGSLVATYSLQVLLDENVPWWFAQDNALSLLDRDDGVVARAPPAVPGRGVYTHKRALDLPGASIVLATDSVKGAPKLLPNLLVGSVIVLALGLCCRWRRCGATSRARWPPRSALRQQMAFRTAMENSLLTGLRARDLEGRVTYVNPAFCRMVGLPPKNCSARSRRCPTGRRKRWPTTNTASPACWPAVTPQFETVFQRSDGVRVPVLVFEAPLVDSRGDQTGWMSSILDITDRKRAEELAASSRKSWKPARAWRRWAKSPRCWRTS
jgi:two-component system sensor histidine kinase DctS